MSIILSSIIDILLEDVGILVGVILLILVMMIGILFDIIGVSVTTAEEKLFHAMASNNIEEGKIAIGLIKNADKVSSFCNDVIGDMAGIISGALGATLLTKIALHFDNVNVAILGTLITASVYLRRINSMRLDKYISEFKNIDSRTKAKKLILAGFVLVNGKALLDPSYDVKEEDNIDIDSDNDITRYVSRGALKLIKAIEAFKLDINDKTCIDIGSSTGGFTDVLVKLGARLVYALDVGKDQLHPSLKINDKVISYESFDARNISNETFDEDFDIVTSDLSFISLTLLRDAFDILVKEDTKLIVLIKPQFESGKIKRKNGIFNDAKLHINAINNVILSFREKGIYLNDICKSPIEGGEGNIEYLALFTRDDNHSNIDIRRLVKESLSRWRNA